LWNAYSFNIQTEDCTWTVMNAKYCLSTFEL